MLSANSYNVSTCTATKIFMMKRIPFFTIVFLTSFIVSTSFAQQKKRNVVFILADDLGYGDLGIYGQKWIQTPHLDRLAKEGMLFTDFYAGAPVCSPSRSVLLTGLHTGHTTIRGNATIRGGRAGRKGTQTVHRANLNQQDLTIGHVMQQAGYQTAMIGKWHLDGYDTLATPLHRGFDQFSGWLISYPETYASTYWPAKRYVNGAVKAISKNQHDKKGYYETNLCTDEAIAFLHQQKGSTEPFFLMVNYNNPHSPLDVPDTQKYDRKNWSIDLKTYASMVNILDQSVGKIKDQLIADGLDKNTLLIFCSDNGPRSENTDQLTEVADFFDSNGPLTGYKRDLYEGGIRVPFIAWAPGYVKAGTVNKTPAYFADILPTLTAIAQSTVAYKTDGQSILPEIKGTGKMPDRFLYWEFFEKGFEQAARYGKWKAIKKDNKIALYDLDLDLAEQRDETAKHPELVNRFQHYLDTCRTPSPYWPTESEKNTSYNTP